MLQACLKCRWTHLIMAIFALVIGLHSWYSYERGVSAELNQIDARLRTALMSIPAVLGESFHDRTLSAGAIDREQDWRNIDRLTEIAREINATFLYSALRRDGHIYLTSSSASEQELREGTQVHYYDTYDDAGPELRRALDVDGYFTSTYTDHWGTFRAVFRRFVTPEGRTWVAGAEVDISQVRRAHLREALEALGWASVYLTLGLLLAWSYARSLRRAKERYELAIAGTQDGIWDWNLQTSEVHFSARWKQMLGFEADELPDQISTWMDRVHPDDMARVQIDIDDHLEGRTRSYENTHRMRCKDGSWKWILDRGRAVCDASGTPVRFIGCHTDIDRRVRLEQELRELNATLDERVRAEVERNREKDLLMLRQSRMAAMGEMLAMIAHQWRQPLSYVSSAVSMLGTSMAAGMPVDELQDKIQERINYMSQTIDDFRSFLREDRRMEQVDVRQVLQRALVISEAGLAENSVQVQQHHEPSPRIAARSGDLIQVVLSILKNATDALQERRIAQPTLRIASWSDEESVFIDICDNAGGIDQAHLERIFEPYFSTKGLNGTGIGLYMCQVLMQGMHGTIGAYNSDEGACFRLSFAQDSPERQPGDDHTKEDLA